VVVIEAPALEPMSGVGEVLEDLLVQELVAPPADEALDEGVLLRLAGHDVAPVDAGAVGPRQDGARGELRTIVADDRRRRTTPGNEPVELARDAGPGDRRVGDRRQALAGEVVDHHQDAEAPGGQAIRDEVERPALIRRLRHSQRRPRAGRALAATPAAHRQALLAVPPIQLLAVHAHALALEQDPEPPVAEAPPLAGQAP
jgi:hypothetical protein